MMMPILLIAAIQAAAAQSAAAAQGAPAPSGPPKTPSEVVAQAPASAWKNINPDDILVIDVKDRGHVVIQLAPDFAPVHVANIKALARAGYWQGAAIYRVQDNYVVQWGNNDTDKALPKGVVAQPPAEYHRNLAGLAIKPLGSPDAYAPAAGYALGWPIAYDPQGGTANLTHCYATVGVGRGLSPDTGMGGELYTVIGHGPRQLDRNIAIVGRIIQGMEYLTVLPRGTEALGFYKERTSDVPLTVVRLGSQYPAAEQPHFQYLDTMSQPFADYLRLRANRKDDFYIRPAGGVDLCNAPVPVRQAPRGERG